MDLEIKDLSSKGKSNKITVHENLPVVPFYATVTGKSNSGKTNMICNMIKFYKKVFKKKHIFVFSKTYSDTFNSIDGINTFTNHIIDGECIITELMKVQSKVKADNEKPQQILLIFDDYITDNSFNSRRSVFTKLFSMGRHYNLSTIVTSQEYLTIPSQIRRMSLYNICYKIYNADERNKFLRENQRTLSLDEFERLFDVATKEPYNFIYIDTLLDRVYHNFTQRLH
jgi:hypothetical protein